MTQFEGKALGLDKAILHSIDCCGKNGTPCFVSDE